MYSDILVLSFSFSSHIVDRCATLDMSMSGWKRNWSINEVHCINYALTVSICHWVISLKLFQQRKWCIKKPWKKNNNIVLFIIIFISEIVLRILVLFKISFCPVGWDCRIHQLLLCRGVRPHVNECPGFDTKQSDDEVPVMQEFWEMQSTPSLPSLPGPLWLEVVAPDKGHIYELNRTKLCELTVFYIKTTYLC